MIERIADVAAGIFGVPARGTLTAKDCKSVVAPVVEDVIRGGKRLRCLVDVSPEVVGVTQRRSGRTSDAACES